MIINCRIYC